jgi:uncharacterized protein YecT (DUF1311 family)
MKYKFLSLFLLTFSLQSHSASFDCAKAKSKFEKFICANPALDEADKKMGEAYQDARKKITLKGYLTADQKYWLKDEYNICGSRSDKTQNELVQNCLKILNKRISDLNLMKNAEIYTNYDGDYTDGEESGTLQILENAGKIKLKLQGNKFSTPSHISYCWREVDVLKKGNKFFEEGEKEALFIKNKDSIELLQRIGCNGPVGEMTAQKFKIR